jgi:hypothetical protein
MNSKLLCPLWVYALAYAGIMVPTQIHGFTLNQAGVSMRILPAKDTILPGEPLTLRVEFSNANSTDIQLNAGAAGIQSYSFALFNSESRQVCKTANIQTPGLSTSGRLVVPSQSSMEKALLLNVWCPTLLSVGPYKLVISYRDVDHPSILLTSECVFKVVRQNIPALQEIFSAEAVRILDNVSVEQTLFSIKRLSYSGSPYAVPYIAQTIASEKVDSTYKTELIRGLGRIRTRNSATLVAQIVRGESYTRELKSAALIAAYEIFDNTKKRDVLYGLRPIIKRFPRPTVRRVID